MPEQPVQIKILRPFRSYVGGETIRKRAEIAARYVADGYAEYVGAAPKKG